MNSPDAATIRTPHFVIGSLLALAMALTFFFLSHGRSLQVTFVPGVVAAWLLFATLWRKQLPLPSFQALAPLYLTTIAVQCIHFAEEYSTGFRVAFPQKYGGDPYSDTLFVSFNMAAYAIFVMTFLLGFLYRKHFLLVPVLFFIVYGALGNAISHTFWSLTDRGYFPGFFSAQPYWLLAPLLLTRLAPRPLVTAISLLFAVALCILVAVFQA